MAVTSLATRPDHRKRLMEFTVPEMADDQHAGRIAALLKSVPGITAVLTDPHRHKVRVHFDPQVAGLAIITEAIEHGGCVVADIAEPGVSSCIRELHLLVPAMTCEHYAAIVCRSLKRLPGVLSVTCDLLPARVRVRFDSIKVESRMIRAAVVRTGFEVDEETSSNELRPPIRSAPGHASHIAARIEDTP